MIFHYYDKKEEGAGYNVESPKTFKKMLGKTEDISLDKLASLVMMQLARRDIMIFDVEPYEYTKKKITFKETKGGVVIKNKKFSLDGSSVIEIQEEEKDIPVVQNIQQKPRIKAESGGRYEIFNPHPQDAVALRSKYNLTPKNRYVISQEKIINGVLCYSVENDVGNISFVPCHFFDPIPVGLKQEFIGSGEFMDNSNAPMPALRR